MEKEGLKKEETKQCPLCGTVLPHEKWLTVVGVHEEQQKHQKQLELALIKAKRQESKLKKEYKEIKRKEREIRKIQQKKFKEKLEGIKQKRVEGEKKLEQKFQKEQEKMKKKIERQRKKEIREARNKAIKEGIEKQKLKTKRVEQMADKHRRARNKLTERVKELEEMIKKGTTPQAEGLKFEEQFINALKQEFPKDELKPTGKEGDIIHTVKVKKRKIGRIIYECKKTKEFKNEFIKQIQRDKAKASADYGVIVSWARKNGKKDFWMKGEIFIVHPYGALDIAKFLRKTLVELYESKLSKEEVEAKGRAILEFVHSNEFKIRIQNSIVKNREVYELLKKEIQAHLNEWKKRFKIYESINKDTNIIENTVKHILLHGKIPKDLPKLKSGLPPIQIPPKDE